MRAPAGHQAQKAHDARVEAFKQAVVPYPEHLDQRQLKLKVATIRIAFYFVSVRSISDN